MGDFNEIMERDEHSGFSNLLRVPNSMRYFQRMVLHCHLTDMGYQGLVFTWCNKRDEGSICKKLDRILMNDVAFHRFTNATQCSNLEAVLIRGGAGSVRCSLLRRFGDHSHMLTPLAVYLTSCQW